MSEVAYLLVGDHLGQVKKVWMKSGEIRPLNGCAEPSSSNPVVSIEPFQPRSKHLIANKNGQLYVHDSISDKVKPIEYKANDDLIKALPIRNEAVLVYDKFISQTNKVSDHLIKLKSKSEHIHNAKLHLNNLSYVGERIPLRVFDLDAEKQIFQGDLPEKNWLRIQPDCFVAGLEILGGGTKVATCSKSDSVIRIFDTRAKSKPAISIDINQTAFNEHADSARFISIASSGVDDHNIVIGSNVGQILGIDLRLNGIKDVPKKRRKGKLQPREYKMLGSFKGSRGASIKDLKLVDNFGGDRDCSDSQLKGYKVISCSLDRYIRVHDFTRQSRGLYKHFYMTTKPLCCSPVFDLQSELDTVME